MAFRAVAYQRKLQDEGIDPKVAQAHAAAMEEFVVSELVTRDYLDTRLAEVEVRLIRWLVGTVGAATLAIVLTSLRVAK